MNEQEVIVCRVVNSCSGVRVTEEGTQTLTLPSGSNIEVIEIVQETPEGTTAVPIVETLDGFRIEKSNLAPLKREEHANAQVVEDEDLVTDESKEELKEAITKLKNTSSMTNKEAADSKPAIIGAAIAASVMFFYASSTGKNKIAYAMMGATIGGIAGSIYARQK